MVEKLLKRLQYYLAVFKRKYKTPGTLKKLIRKTDPNIQHLAVSFGFFHTNRSWSEREKQFLKKLDVIRTSYKKSTEQILVEDFGAGNPYAERTKEEMINGVAEYQSVSNIYMECSSPDKWGLLIFRLVSELKPVNCLELGTCLGISAMYQLLALQLNNVGKFTTIEGAPELVKIVKRELSKFEFKNYTVHTGKFIDVLPGLLKKSNPYDFVFIDGHHDELATMEYFELIYPYLADCSFVIFDDINWSDGMKAFWRKISCDNRIILTLDLYKWGICYIDKNNKKCSSINYFLYI